MNAHLQDENKGKQHQTPHNNRGRESRVGPLLQPQNHRNSTDLIQKTKDWFNFIKKIQSFSEKSRKLQTQLRSEMIVLLVVLEELPLGRRKSGGPEIRIHQQRKLRKQIKINSCCLLLFLGEWRLFDFFLMSIMSENG